MIGFVCAIPLISALFDACSMPPPLATGYVEGEYVLIAPLASAQLLELPVARGDRVAAGQTVAVMESADAQIAVAQAQGALAQAENQLANLQEGSRIEEIHVLEASLASAKAQADVAERRQREILGLVLSARPRAGDRADLQLALLHAGQQFG